MAIGIIGKMFISTFLIFIVAMFVHYVKKLRLYLKASRFPGPPTIPFIGNAFNFVGNTTDIHNVVTNLMHTYPSPFIIWLGSRAFFVAYEPEHLKVILNSPKSIGKDELYGMARPWVGDGLLTAPTAIWRVHRRLITPTFHQKILDSFVEIFAKKSEILVTQMKKELNGNEFIVFEYVSLCTLDIICETAMGIEIDAQTQMDHPFILSIKRIFQILISRVFKVWLHPDFVFNLTQMGKDHRECIKHLHSITDEVLERKKNPQNPGDQLKKQNTEEKSTGKKIFLDLLMELSDNGTKFTIKELRDEINTMIVAGNDTTATVNSFVLLMLANYPDIQETAYQELCDIFGDEVSSSSRPITNDDLNRMKYLERVVKETLRVFPVAPFIVRAITEDLDIGEFTLPKESSVVIGIFKTHRSEKYWPDPLKFDPDRFLPEEVAKRHPYCYIPFSGGPRNCLGMKYAMMAMKVLISTILRRYVLRLDKICNINDIKLKGEVILQTVEPIKMKIEERSRCLQRNNNCRAVFIYI